MTAGLTSPPPSIYVAAHNLYCTAEHTNVYGLQVLPTLSRIQSFQDSEKHIVVPAHIHFCKQEKTQMCTTTHLAWIETCYQDAPPFTCFHFILD